MFDQPRRHALRRMRAAAPDDRRSFQRFGGVGLMVRLENQFIDVNDISLGGFCIPRQSLAVGRALVIQLIPREGSKLSLNHSIRAEAVVVGSCETLTHLRFTSVSYTLAKMIIRQAARTTGVQPFLVK